MTSRNKLPTITAELKQWRLDDERNIVEGIIFNSKSRYYKDGERFILKPFWSIAEYNGYHLIRTQTGLYFKISEGDIGDGQPVGS